MSGPVTATAALALMIAASCVACTDADEQPAFDAERWRSWPSAGDEYDMSRLNMVDSIRSKLLGKTEQEVVALLGAPDKGVLTPENGCVTAATDCRLLLYNVGYQQPPIRFDALALYVRVEDGKVISMTVGRR